MIRATTPTHTFTFPDEIQPSEMEEILITYSQCGKKVIEKKKDDLDLHDNSVSITFTQKEMNRFKPGTAEIQVRAKNQADDVAASQIFRVKVKQVLNEEIL